MENYESSIDYPVHNQREARTSNRKQIISRLFSKENLSGWVFILPAFILLIVFWIYPIGYSFYLSFLNWDMLSPPSFVGAEHYQTLMNSADFKQSLLNTGLYTFFYVIGVVVIGMMLALLVNQQLKGIGFFRMLLFSPHITPIIAISIVWMSLYDLDDGLLNALLTSVGLPEGTWLASSDTVLMSLIIMGLWKAVGYYMMFFLAALQSVPLHIYEAGRLDGANRWQMFWHITLPFISPITFFVVIVSIIEAFQTFDQIAVMTQGGPSNSSLVLVYYLYRHAFEYFNIGFASAIAIVLFLSLVVFSVVQYFISRKWVHH
ncbi:carbohydrate ABC transporter permease [Pseudalkalibacillus berkeleyi]|uniref:Sugar ABC transporter permease n=1 Tax=Pseudalkalibacillus berkeleyi TaxID=1069813 RepID=A0ABS9GYE3_9BACL|nr:sugar ABC transporter permease [Pseudalkalibacillus berkeleyi]MCF6136625.1 sugar ABC transporter permease [Pseudalkalibacillus berkeleyi]